MTDSTRDWADIAARHIEIEYGTSWPIAGLAVYLRDLVANREAFALMQGRAQGMREAAEIAESHKQRAPGWTLVETAEQHMAIPDLVSHGYGNAAHNISYAIRTRADAIERGE